MALRRIVADQQLLRPQHCQQSRSLTHPLVHSFIRPFVDSLGGPILAFTSSPERSSSSGDAQLVNRASGEVSASHLREMVACG